MPKLVLGTAQLGLNYGVHNQTGKPGIEESFSILDSAWNNGIRILDTAYSYGDSEKIIGKYLNKRKNEFKICSKLPSVEKRRGKTLKSIIETTTNNLNIQNINYYLLHDPDDLRNKNLINKLNELKDRGIIENLGVSVYETSTARKVIDSNNFEAIQIPLNIFDRRFESNGLLKEFERSGIEIFIRSVFLQGLLFYDPNKVPSKLSKAKDPLRRLNQFVRKKEIGINELIFDWYKKNNFGDYLVVGVETHQQLSDNVEAFNKKLASSISREFNDLVQDFKISEDSIIIDPRKW